MKNLISDESLKDLNDNFKDKKAIENDNGIIIHYITDYGVDGFVNTHTHGMEKHGFLNLCTVVGYDHRFVGNMLNRITDAIINEKDFDFHAVHSFDSRGKRGKVHTDFRVVFVPVICCEEKCYLVVELDKRGNFKHWQNEQIWTWPEVKVKLLGNME